MTMVNAGLKGLLPIQLTSLHDCIDRYPQYMHLNANIIHFSTLLSCEMPPVPFNFLHDV